MAQHHWIQGPLDSKVRVLLLQMERGMGMHLDKGECLAVSATVLENYAYYPI